MFFFFRRGRRHKQPRLTDYTFLLDLWLILLYVGSSLIGQKICLTYQRKMINYEGRLKERSLFFLSKRARVIFFFFFVMCYVEVSLNGIKYVCVLRGLNYSRSQMRKWWKTERVKRRIIPRHFPRDRRYINNSWDEAKQLS